MRGQLTEAELETFPAEERANIQLFRGELAKPEEERFAPEPAEVIRAVREQLGLEVSLERRSLPRLVVERATSAQ
jgi:hypothetical protein